MLYTTLIKAFDIPSAWYKIVQEILKYGVNQKLQSYDEYARTLYNLLVHIDHPETKPMNVEVDADFLLQLVDGVQEAVW